MKRRITCLVLAFIVTFVTLFGSADLTLAKTDEVANYKFTYDENSPLLVETITPTPTEEEPSPAPIINEINQVTIEEDSAHEAECLAFVENYFTDKGQKPEFVGNQNFHFVVQKVEDGSDAILTGPLTINVEIPADIKTQILANQYLKLYRYTYDASVNAISDLQAIELGSHHNSFAIDIDRSVEYGFALGLSRLQGQVDNVQGCNINYLGSVEIPADTLVNIDGVVPSSISNTVRNRFYTENDVFHYSYGMHFVYKNENNEDIDTFSAGNVQTTIALPAEVKTKYESLNNVDLYSELVVYEYKLSPSGFLQSIGKIASEYDLTNNTVSFTSKGSSYYFVALVSPVKGNDGTYEYIDYTVGGVTKKLIKTSSTTTINVPVTWVDNNITKYRSSELDVIIYGGNQSGNADDENDYIIKGHLSSIDKTKNSVTVKVENVPIYIDYSARSNSEGGDGTWTTQNNFYHVKLVPVTGYTPVPESRDVVLNKDENDKKWSPTVANFNNKLEDLVDADFSLEWCDNRNFKEVRPFTSSLNETINAPAEGWGDYFELWFETEDRPGEYRSVNRHISDFLPGMEATPEVTLVGTGKWSISYKNLPKKVYGQNVTYYCGITETMLGNKCVGDNYSYVVEEGDGSYHSDGYYHATVFGSDHAAHMMYQDNFMGSIYWYDGNSASDYRPDSPEELNLIFTCNGTEITIPDEDITWETEVPGNPNLWKFTIKNRDSYTVGNKELVYGVTVKNNKIDSKNADASHIYSVGYDNAPYSTNINICLNGGAITAIMRSDVEPFEVHKKWYDDGDEAARKEAIAEGIQLYLWRYTDKIGSTIENGSAVTEGGNQLSYKLVDADSTDFDITFDMFTSNTLPRYSEEGYPYIYYVTEEIECADYKSIYVNQDGTIGKKAAFNNGSIRNAKATYTNLFATKEWSTTATEDYVGSNVTLRLQEKRNVDGVDTWVNVEGIEPITISGFSSSQKSKSNFFSQVDIYDNEGQLRDFRVVETKINSHKGIVDLDNSDYTEEGNRHTAEYTINGGHYAVTTSYDPDKRSFYITNEITNTLFVDFDLQWVGDLNKWNEYAFDDAAAKHKGVADKIITVDIPVYQNAVKIGTIHVEPYDSDVWLGIYPDEMTAETKGKIKKARFISLNDEIESQDMVVNITQSGSTVHWKLSEIKLPALDNGVPYIYTITENVTQTKSDVDHSGNPVDVDLNNATFYRLYDYQYTDSEHQTIVAANHLTTEGGDATTILSFQKEWNDNEVSTYRENVLAVPVRVGANIDTNPKDYAFLVKKADGSIEYVDPDTFAEGWGTTYKKENLKYCAELSASNTWKRNMIITNRDFFVDVEGESTLRKGIVEIIGDRIMAIDSTSDFASEVTGTIAAKVDADDTLHMGFAVQIVGNKTDYLSTEYVLTNTRAGQVKIVVDKEWADGDNAHNTRQDKLKLYFDQMKNGVATGETYSVEISHDDSSITDINKYTLSYPTNDSDPVLPLFDENGGTYGYDIREYLVDDSGTETEISLFETEKSTKTGYVSKRTDTASLDIIDGVYTETLSYTYVNSLLGLRTDATTFYKIWNDEYNYLNNLRPDVHYILYYSLGDGEIKRYDANEALPEYTMSITTADTTDNPFYQELVFKGLPNGAYVDGEYHLYNYYLAQAYSGNSSDYHEQLYNPASGETIIAEPTTDNIPGSTTAFYYKVKDNAVESTYKTEDGTSVVAENGAFSGKTAATIKITGNKVWFNTAGVKVNHLPQARIYLWRESDYDKTNKCPDSITSFEDIKKNVNFDQEEYETTGNDGSCNLDTGRSGYKFEKEYPKYDDRGAIYTYSVTETIITADADPERQFELPDFIMDSSEVSLTLSNTYHPDSNLNHRSITVRKEWDTTSWEKYRTDIDKDAKEYKAVARFKLYQFEYEDAISFVEGANIDLTDSSLTTADGKNYPAYTVPYKETGMIKTISIDSDTQTATWDDLPIYAPSGHPYVYFVEEITDQGLDSYTITNNATLNSKGNVIEDGVAVYQNRKLTEKLVMISNYGINPSEWHEGDPIPAYEHEVEFTNTYVDQAFVTIEGSKIWVEDAEFTSVRPLITDPNIHITLYRSVSSQAGANNGLTKETIPEDAYTITWEEAGADKPNEWKFRIEAKSSADVGKTHALPVYSPNGRVYTYYAEESYDAGTNIEKNYTITTKSVYESAKNSVGDGQERILKLSQNKALKNTLKGNITVSKTWRDYNNEYGLRSNVIKGVLQYRLVNPADSTDYTSDPKYGWKEYIDNNMVDASAKLTDEDGAVSISYSDTASQNWKKSFANLPIYNQAGDEKYEYRFVEFYILDYGVVERIDYKDTSKIPNNYADPSAGEYDSATGTLKIKLRGNHSIIEPPPFDLVTSAKKTTNVRNELDSDSTTQIKIVKNWDDENDCTGVRPKSILFRIESRFTTGSGEYSEWKPVTKTKMDADGNPIPGETVILKLTSDFKQPDGSWMATYSNLPKNGPDSSGNGFAIIEYRAVELGQNLGRYNGYVDETSIMDGQISGTGVDGYSADNDGTAYITSLKNILTTRSLTVTKKWNDNDPDHNEEVTIALYSKNFNDDNPDNDLTEVPGTERTLKLSVDNSYTTTYEKLPQKNNVGDLIQYYVVEKNIDKETYSQSGYDLDVYYTADDPTSDAAVYQKVEPTLDDNYAIALIDHEGSPSTKVILVNTPMSTISAKKAWVDEKNRHNLRTSVAVSLYTAENGEKQHLVTSDADGTDISSTNPASFTTVDDNVVSWNKIKAFKSVDAADVATFVTGNGVSQEYMVVENEVSNYATTYKTTDSLASTEDNTNGLICIDPTKVNTDEEIYNLVTVSNTYVPKKGKLTVDKLWEDTNNLYKSRPDEVKIALYYRVGTTGNWSLITKKDDISAYGDGGIYTTSDVVQVLKKENVDASNANLWSANDTTSCWKDLPIKKLVTNGDVTSAVDVYYKAFEVSSLNPETTITDAKGSAATIDSVISGYTAKSSESKGSKFAESDLIKAQQISNALDRIKVKITKTFDESTADGKNATRPQSVIFGLEYKHGSHDWETLMDPTDSTKEFEVVLTDNGSGTWVNEVANLPKKDSANQDYSYRVKEKAITYSGSGSQLIASGEFDVTEMKWAGTAGPYTDTVSTVKATTGEYQYIATAGNELAEANLTIHKVWDDESNREGKRPTSTTYTLYRDGVKYGDSVTITAPNNSYTWAHIPKYKNDATAHDASNLSEYYVVETAVSGYTTTYGISAGDILKTDATTNIVKLADETNSIYVKNTYVPVRIAIQATKQWSDENNKYHVRPTSAELTLEYQLEGESTWNAVEERDEYSSVDETGAKVETTSLVSQTVVKKAADTDNVWSADGWNDLPVYALDASGNSKKITYRVQEVNTNIHYTSNDNTAAATYTYGGSVVPVTIDITNTIIGSSYTYTVTKEWGDYDLYDSHNAIPERVHVKIQYSTDSGSTWKELAGGIGNYDLTAANNWSHAFADLNDNYMYRATEEYIVYKDAQGQEQKVEAVSSGANQGIVGSFSYVFTPGSATGSTGSGTIVNSLPQKSLTITKVWDDEGDRDRLRSDDVTVMLLRDGAIIHTDTLNAANSFSVTYDNLPVYQNGKAAQSGNESSYEVQEVGVANYDSSYVLDDGTSAATCEFKFTADTTSEAHTVKVINAYRPKKAEIKVDEVFNDAHNKCGTRPDEVYVTLLYKVGDGEDWKPISNYDSTTYETNGNAYPDNKVYTTSKTTQKVDVKAIDEAKSEDRFSACGIWENLPMVGTKDGTGVPEKVYYKVVQTTADPLVENEPKCYKLTNSDVIEPFADDENKGTIRNDLISTSLEVTKTWDDQDNRYISRPDSVTFTLQRRVKTSDGTPNAWETVTNKSGIFAIPEPITISVGPDADGNWKGVFDLLPVSDVNGDPTDIFEYRAVETEMVFHDKTVSVYAPDEQNINQDKLVASYESSATASYESSNDIFVEMAENRLATTELTVAVDWDDNDNKWASRPTAIRFVVERKAKTVAGSILEFFGIDTGWDKVQEQIDGEESFVEVILNGNSFEEVVLTGLPAYDQDDNAYVYRAREEALIYAKGEILLSDANAPYSVVKYNDLAVDDDMDPNGYKTIATNKLKTIDVTVTKEWDDRKDIYQVRPKDIDLVISNQNGKLSQKLKHDWSKKDNKWVWNIEGLPQYLNGTTTKVQYTFTEGDVKNYIAAEKTVAEVAGKVLIKNALSDEFISSKEANGNNNDGNSKKRPRTGDDTPVGIIIAILFGTIILGFSSMFIYYKKRKNK